MAVRAAESKKAPAALLMAGQKSGPRTHRGTFCPVSLTSSAVSASSMSCPSRVFFQRQLLASQLYRRGPLTGDDHHSCRFGVCLFITYVPGLPRRIVSTPIASERSNDSSSTSSSADPSAVSRRSNVLSALPWNSASLRACATGAAVAGEVNLSTGADAETELLRRCGGGGKSKKRKV